MPSKAPHRSSEQLPRRPGPLAVTIKEVAARARVSVATVSRVLNGKGPVREDTWQRVLEVAQDMRYVPHGVARSLSTRQSNTIGVVLPDLYGEFFSEVIRGIDLAARRAGYHILLSGSHSETEEMSAVLSAVRGRVDGLIVMSPDLEATELCSSLPEGMPLVLLNCLTKEGCAITIDNYGGAYQMVRHLTALGHRRIAFLRGPDRNVDACERLRGYRDAMHRFVTRQTSALELPGEFTEESGYEAGKQILELSPRPTAIFAANDAMAIGALYALRMAGTDVPAEIAVAGFDDIPIARYVNPPLTTVSVAIAELGRRAFELLMRVIENGETSGQETLPTTLLVRESCGAAQAARAAGLHHRKRTTTTP